LYEQGKIPAAKVSFSLQFYQTEIPSTMTLGGAIPDDYVGSLTNSHGISPTATADFWTLDYQGA
jgi:hypothetical protein